MKNKTLWGLTALTLGAIVLFSLGCEEKTVAETSEVPLCMGCGEIKGAEACCKPDAEKCGCGMAKGSPGCCKIPEGAEKASLCTGCGQLKGSEACCKPGQEKCGGCNLDKGAPGCCKLPKKEAI